MGILEEVKSNRKSDEFQTRMQHPEKLKWMHQEGANHHKELSNSAAK